MLEPTQILLVVVITILTVILIIIGVQIFFILKEFKKSIKKLNKLLDDGICVSSVVARSFTGVSEVLNGIKAGLSLLNIFKKERKEENGEED